MTRDLGNSQGFPSRHGRAFRPRFDHARLLVIAFAMATGLALPGCRTDPGGQQAIGMLRAEKLQLEDRYYALESKYNMALQELKRTGRDISTLEPEYTFGDQPTPAVRDRDEGPAMEIDDLQIPDIIIGGEDDEPIPVPQGAQQLPPPQNPQTLLMDDPAERQMAQYVTDIAVETDADLSGGLTLSVQPIDDRGDVIPIPGDLQVRVVDATKPQSDSLAFWRYSRSQVASWVNDRPDRPPGILTTLPWEQGQPSVEQMRVEVLFRPVTGQTFRGSTALTGYSTVDDPDGVIIEIGDTTVSGESRGANRPSWSPDR